MLDAHVHHAILKFREDREWEQFHTPLNLAVAISVEAGELLEHFQWMTSDEQRPSSHAKAEVEQEVADIAILLSYLSHDLGIDVSAAVMKKLALNAERYPVDKSRGRALKYDQL